MIVKIFLRMNWQMYAFLFCYSFHSIVAIRKKCTSHVWPNIATLEETRNSGWCVVAKSLQSCPTLCDPIDGRLPGSPIPGILQTWTLEWVAISFSNALKWKVKRKSLSRVRLFMTPWAAANQAHPSMGFSRREYWSGVPSPSPPKEARKD